MKCHVVGRVWHEVPPLDEASLVLDSRRKSSERQHKHHLRKGCCCPLGLSGTVLISCGSALHKALLTKRQPNFDWLASGHFSCSSPALLRNFNHHSRICGHGFQDFGEPCASKLTCSLWSARPVVPTWSTPRFDATMTVSLRDGPPPRSYERCYRHRRASLCIFLWLDDTHISPD